MDHGQTHVVAPIDFTPRTLQGAPVYGEDDQRLGQVTEVHGTGSRLRVVVDVGAFLGRGHRSVQIATRDVTFMRDDDGKVYGLTNLTRAEVMALPEPRP